MARKCEIAWPLYELSIAFSGLFEKMESSARLPAREGGAEERNANQLENRKRRKCNKT